MVDAGHRVLDALPEELQAPVFVPGRARGVEDEYLVGAVGNTLQRRDRIGQVVEDPLEQADVEPLVSQAFARLEQVEYFESDLLVRLAEVPLQESGLLDPMVPHIEAEAVRAEIARQEAVATGVARAVQEALAIEATRVEALQERSKFRGIDQLHALGATPRTAISG